MKKILLFTSILFLTITTSLFAQHPDDLQYSNLTSSSVNLTWDATICTGDVHLQFRITGSGFVGWTQLTSGVSSPYLLTGLVPGTSYDLKVRCDGITGWSTQISFTTPLADPLISDAFISQPILCNDAGATSVSAEIQIEINQTASPTGYACIIGSFPFSNSYFSSYLTTNQTTASVLNLTGFNPNVDYCIRIVDSAVYYSANNGGASGTSNLGVYDQFCSINFFEPAQLVASTSIVDGNSCVGDCIATQELTIQGGTQPYNYTLNANPIVNLGPQSYNITNLGNTFTPDTIECNIGDTIIFNLQNSHNALEVDQATYNANGIATNGGFDIPFGASNVTFLPTLAQTYYYVCSPHVSLGMKGVIIVNSTPSNTSIDTLINLCADTFNLEVSDANGCITSPSITSFIIAPTPNITPEGTISDFNGYNVSCNGFLDGTITASASGGTGAFTYSIDGTNFQSNSNFQGLSEGTFAVAYRDANDCIASESFILNEPPALSGTASVTQNIVCYNDATGEITFTVDPAQPGFPGVTGYQYSIDNGVNIQSSNIFANLNGNLNYDVMILDTNGCQYTSSDSLGGPAQIIYSTILSNYNNYEVSCNLLSDGSIEFTNTVGGLAPYEYSTDGGGSFDIATVYSSLSSGIYNIEVKDASGCIENSIDTLDDPGLFSVPYTVSNAIDCPGDCNGTISIIPSNGVGQVEYTWDNGSPQTSPDFSGLCGDITNGSYALNAVDDNGCTSSATISLTEPTVFMRMTSSSLEYCDQSNGQASITVTSGGTGILLYIWNTVPVQNSAVANNLVAGTYMVEVTDGNSCQFTESVTVSEDIGFTVSYTQVSPCLGDSSGSATVTATGTPPYSYEWSDINGLLTGETSATISNMPLGTYSVLVTDATNCVIGKSIDIISQVFPIVIDSLVVTNSSCFGDNDAQIEIFSSGGQQPYDYSNSNGLNYQPDSVFVMLIGDSTYTLRVRDGNLCFDDTTITLSYPIFLEIDSTVFTHISCFGLDDGAIQNIQIVGGTSPFEFTVDAGIPQTYMPFTGLDPGLHNIMVKDANNCENGDIIIINEPSLFEVETTVSNWNNYQIRCNGDSLGYVNIISSGGTTPYLTDSITFWNTITIDSLWAGNHTFIVQDANGCTYQDSILFQEPSSIAHNFITNHVTCISWNNGSVTDSVYGGVGSATTYSYLWDSGETTYSLSNLSAGTYPITVTDENGCEDIDSVIINDSSALSVAENMVGHIGVGCFDDCDGELSVTASGGVPFTGSTSYTYLWNDYLGQNTETAVGLCVDSITLTTFYDCIVTDAVGCEYTLSLELEQPPEFQITDVFITDSIDCKGFSDGKLKAIVTATNAPYTYSWSNGITSITANEFHTIANLAVGIYKVTVEDANTCRDTFEIYLDEPSFMEISIQEFDISCNDSSDGSIEVLASGGNSFEATYSYTLYLNGTPVADTVNYEAGSVVPGPQTPFIFTNLSPGNYYVIAKDRNGCEVTSLSVEIIEPFEPLTVLVDSVNETCLLNAPGQNGIIRIFPQGGSQMFKYFIDGVQTPTSSNFSPNALITEDIILPGWHNILVVDSRNCSISDVTYIKAYDPIFLPDTVSYLEYTICLGQSINIDVEERSNLTYTWNDGVIGGDRVIKPEGVLPYGIIYSEEYVVTVTDLEGCEIQGTVTVDFDAIDPMIDSDPGVLYGDYPVVLEGGNIDLFSNNTGDDIEYTWRWADNIITNTGDNSITISEALADVWYYLDIEDADECLGYDSIYVVVGIKALGESTVYEAFTPNGDTYNDVWNILNIASYPTAIVQVFNRWGALVHETSGGDVYVAWDGTYYNDGKELPVGTYYYIIDLNTGDAPQTGPITIIR